MLSTASAVNTEQQRIQFEHASWNSPDATKQTAQKTAAMPPVSAAPIPSPTESLKQQVGAGKGMQRRLTGTLRRAFSGTGKQPLPEKSALAEKQRWEKDLQPLEHAIEHIQPSGTLKKCFNPAMPLAEFERMLKLAAKTTNNISPARKPHHHALQNELCLIDSIQDHLSVDMTGDQFKHLFNMALFATDLTTLSPQVRRHALKTTIALISFVEKMHDENMTAERLVTASDLALHLVAVTETGSVPNQYAMKLLQYYFMVMREETDSEPEENDTSDN